MALCIGISLLLTPALIEGWGGLPKLGVTSAPWANLAACAISLPALLVYLRFQGHPMAFDRDLLRRLRIDPAIAWSFLGIGIPGGIQMAVTSLSEGSGRLPRQPFRIERCRSLRRRQSSGRILARADAGGRACCHGFCRHRPSERAELIASGRLRGSRRC